MREDEGSWICTLPWIARLKAGAGSSLCVLRCRRSQRTLLAPLCHRQVCHLHSVLLRRLSHHLREEHENCVRGVLLYLEAIGLSNRAWSLCYKMNFNFHHLQSWWDTRRSRRQSKRRWRSFRACRIVKLGRTQGFEHPAVGCGKVSRPGDLGTTACNERPEDQGPEG